MYKQIFEVDQTISVPIEGYPYPLLWREDLGIGFLKSDGYDYGEDYWVKYQSYINDLGMKLSTARGAFVLNNLKTFNGLCDVGIGSGQFIEMVGCKGYDVNEFAVQWLKENDYYADVYKETFNALSFWDVLEHIEDPSELLNKTDKVFVSVPIHKDINACLASKHLRPAEHIWHFTNDGIKNFMRMFGYRAIASSNFETKLGREDIISYYFAKNK